MSNRLERTVELTIFRLRWILVPFYFGLGVALLAYFGDFARTLWHLVVEFPAMKRTDALLTVLEMIDSVLVASLLVMVIISGYENFVSKLDVDAERHNIGWLGKLDAGSLKVKVATSIVAISSIHLLQGFLNAEATSNDKLILLISIHLTFVVSALLMAVLDRISTHK